MDIQFLILSAVIPILTITSIVLIYNYLINFNKQNKIIKKLSNDQNEILAEAKKEIVYLKKIEIG